MRKSPRLPIHTHADIKALKPCYDPVKRGYITVDWRGTALEVLGRSDVLSRDQLWLVLRDGWIPDSILQEFAVWCAEQALTFIDDPDPRSVAALEVKRRWLRGEATDEELRDARRAAYEAADSASSAATNQLITGEVSWSSTYAAIAVARAARAAAHDSANYLSSSEFAAYAAKFAHRAAARDAQVTHLIALLEAYEAEQ